MDKNLSEQIKRLAGQGKFEEIVALIEQEPESGRDRETVGAYVRALNNTGRLERAVEVSLQYKDRDGEDPLWHYRLGYAYINLGRYEEAEALLLRGKELAHGGEPVTEWIDELLVQATKRKEDAMDKAEAEAKRRAAFVPHEQGKPFFDGFDFTGFWDDSEYALKEYAGAPVADEMFAEAERALGYKLPESYKELIRRHNGGLPAYDVFHLPFAAHNEPEEISISSILGVDPSNRWSLCGNFGSRFMIEEWGYPNIGVAICDCPSAGHDMIFLDYRRCGPEGEPEVVHVDQESDYAITYLAGDFESFIRGLVKEEDVSDEEDEDDTDAAYTAVIKHKDSISVCFYIEQDKPFAVGEKMNAINEEAYMNGYNWEAFFKYYLPKYAPDIAEDMETDPEAGMYAAYYTLTPENEAKAEKFNAIIIALVENEEELYRIVREEGGEIEWD
jgi:tetratricopeptide (TPR) repeat protein